MQRVSPRDETEVLDKIPFRRDRLRTHAGPSGIQILRLNLRDQPLQATAKQFAAEAAAQFIPAHGGIAPQEAPEAAVGQGIEQVARTEIGLLVALARKGQDGVRPGLDALTYRG